MKNKSLFIIRIFFLVLASFLFFGASSSCKTQKQLDIEYRGIIRTKKSEYTVTEGDRLTITFRLQNKGQKSWNSSGENPCLLSYHLLDESGQTIQYDNRRYPLPGEINPGQKINLTTTLNSPLGEGKYILEFDLLREGIVWFADYGSKPCRIMLTVKDRQWPEDKQAWTLDYGKFTQFFSSEERFNTLFKLIRLTLHLNETAFMGKTGRISGFSPGSDYPQIWLRDANTIIPSSRFFYPESYLASWLEEHLSFQSEAGSLQDWIDSEGNSEKNTTETDQEASAVQSAYQIYLTMGPQWLQKKIEGEEIIFRLERALSFVRQTRFDQGYGLITGAHTADWGDVDIVDIDEKSVDIDEHTFWTVDIYDQSMFYLACLQLAEMFGELDFKGKEIEWKKMATSLKENTNRWLWQQDKGFYRVHLHLDSNFVHDFDEDNIFAMGGNAMAILSRLADRPKSERIFRVTLDRQKVYEVSTLSGTLLPPYPQDFFRHPLLDTPFEYQNGAQWDWFGGRLVLAMYLQGFSRAASEKLLEIVSKNIANRGFYEWDDRLGTGQGSDIFCGSAGVLGRALFEGYLGIRLKSDGLSLEPRLGRDSCRIHIHFPASDFFVAFDYNFSPDSDRLTFAFNSNKKNKGPIKILSPWIEELSFTSNTQEQIFSVQLDDQIIPFSIDRLNQDIYFVFESDLNNHRLEIKKKD